MRKRRGSDYESERQLEGGGDAGEMSRWFEIAVSFERVLRFWLYVERENRVGF